MRDYIDVHRDDLRTLLRLAEDGLVADGSMTGKLDLVIWERLTRRLNESIPSGDHYATCPCSGCIERRRLEWQADRVTAQGVEDAEPLEVQP